MNRTAALKVTSVVTTVLLAGIAIAIGGGHPLSPALIAESTSEAARNAAKAEKNTTEAAESTRALLTIARNVDSQVRSSRRLLEIQLRLEASSKRGARRSLDLQHGVERVRKALEALREEIAALTRLSESTVSSGLAAADAGDGIEAQLSVLERHFEEVVRQSRRLNKKARGYEEVRDGPR